MELEDIQRKLQFRQGSYVITIPQMVVHSLGLQRDQYFRFAVSGDRIILKPVPKKAISKKDVSESVRDSGHLDDGESPGYMGDLEAALGDSDRPKMDMKGALERLRIK